MLLSRVNLSLRILIIAALLMGLGMVSMAVVQKQEVNALGTVDLVVLDQSGAITSSSTGTCPDAGAILTDTGKFGSVSVGDRVRITNTGANMSVFAGYYAITAVTNANTVVLDQAFATGADTDISYVVTEAHPTIPESPITIVKQRGDTFTVYLWVIPKDQTVAGVDCKIDFVVSYLQANTLAVTTGNLFDAGGLALTKNNTSGYADYSDAIGAESQPITAKFPMYYVTFQVKADSPLGSTNVSFHTVTPRKTKASAVGDVTVTGNLVGFTLKVQAPPVVDFTMDPANGQITAGQNVTFTSQTTSGGPVETWDWDFNNDGTVDSHDANPSYNFDNKAGTYTVKLTGKNTISPTGDSETHTVVVSPSDPAKLIYDPTALPQTPVKAGDTWTTFKVKILDTYDNLTSSTAEVVVTPYLGETAKTFSAGDNSKAAEAGVATFNDLKYNKAETITVKATSGSLTLATSGNIVVNPNDPNKVVFTRDAAATGTVDDKFSTQPIVQIQDAYDNVCTTSNAEITLSAWSAADHNTAGAGVIRNPTMNASSGIANFDNVGYSKPDQIHIKAISGSLTPGWSTTNIQLTVGAPAKLIYDPTALPQTPVKAGDTWTTFKVKIVDQFDNTTASTAEVVVTPYLGETAKTFSAGDNSKAAEAGVATFNDLTYNKAETITVKATSGELALATSGSIVVNPNDPNKVVFTRDAAATGTVDAKFSTQPIVQIQDAYDNVCTTSNAEITLSAWLKTNHDTAGSGVLRNPTMNASSGVANFDNVGYSKLDIIHIKAISGSLTPGWSTTDIQLTVGAPAKLIYDPANLPPTTATAGVLLTTFKVKILDQFDNPTTSGADVLVTPYLGETAKTFSEGNATRTASNGVATFDNLKYNTAETITIKATSSSWAPAVSASLVVSPGPLDHVTITPSHPEVIVSQTVDFNAAAKDAYDNTISGKTFDWSVLDPTAGGIDADGLFTALNKPGDYTDIIKAKDHDSAIFGTASVKVLGVTMTFTAKLQGTDRPYPTPNGFNVPLTLKVYDQSVVLNLYNIALQPGQSVEVEGVTYNYIAPLYTFSTTNTPSDMGAIVVDKPNKKITFTVSGLPVGTFDVTLHTPHALTTLRDGDSALTIATSGNPAETFMGILREGNPNEDEQIAIGDYTMLLGDYLATSADVNKWNNGRCDLDRDGQVRGVDFAILSMNYTKTAPQPPTEP